MRRKLIKQGFDGMTICLPKKWIDKNGLKAGADIEVNESENALIIRSSIIEPKSIIIDLSKYLDTTDSVLYTSFVHRLLHQAYIDGFDTITIRSSGEFIKDYETDANVKLVEYVASMLTNNFIGLEIISESSAEIILAVFSSNESDAVEKIIGRMRFMYGDLFSYLVQNAKTPKNLTLLRQKTEQLLKFSNYGLRLTANRQSLREIFFVLIIINRQLFRLANFLIYKHAVMLSDETVLLLKNVGAIFEMIFKLLFKYDSKLLLDYMNIRTKTLRIVEESKKSDIQNAKVQQVIYEICAELIYYPKNIHKLDTL